PVGEAGRTDTAGGEQHVDPAAGAEVEDDLARAQLGQRGGVATAERGEHRGVGEDGELGRLVQVAGDRVGAGATGAGLGDRRGGGGNGAVVGTHGGADSIRWV